MWPIIVTPSVSGADGTARRHRQDRSVRHARRPGKIGGVPVYFCGDRHRKEFDPVASETGRNAVDYEAESHADGDNEDKTRIAKELVGLIGDTPLPNGNAIRSYVPSVAREPDSCSLVNLRCESRAY